MIHYQLRCAAEHDFDGWFKDSAAFEAQAERGLLQCPACGDTHVSRALMAPAVAKGRADPPPKPPAAPPTAPSLPPAVAAKLPDGMRALLQRIRAEVERNCDYVGNEFADEARRIHNGEHERRGIYGETTPEQAEALADDGIEVASIPWLPRADS